MNDQGKTKEQLINELNELKEELALFKALSSENIQIVSLLRDFKEIYDNFYKSNPHPMWIYDLETLAFLDVNDAAIQHYGYSQEEFLSMTIKDIRPTEDIPALLENITKVTKGLDIAGTWRHIKKDGNLIYVEIISHTMTFTGRQAEIVLAFDTSEWKRAEEDLRKSEQKLGNIIEHSNEIYYVHNADHVFTYVSPQSKQILGYAPEEMMIEWTELLTENPINKTGLEITETALKTGEKQAPYLLELYKKDRNKVLLEIDESPMKDNMGNVLGIVGAARNVTERIMAEKERDRILNMSQDLISVADSTGYFKYINPAWERTLGYSKEELLTKSLFEIVSPDDYQNNYKDYFALLASGKQNIDYENRLIHKDGSTRIFSWTATSLPEEGLVYCIGRNITERKKAEEEIKKRVKELEEFYEMAVGRELRMVQLKKEIEALKEELEQYKKQ